MMKPEAELSVRPLLAMATLLCLAAPAAQAADAAATPPQSMAVVPMPEPDAGDEVTRELIELLSSKGLLSADDAGRLVGKLRTQAAKRVAERNAPQTVPAGAAPAASAAASTAATAATTAADGAAAGEPAVAAQRPPVRVVYLPETEKKRLREEVKQEVIEQAKAENWAQPNALPEWTRRITLGGDFRFRYERDFFDRGNDPFFVNFNALDAGNAFDVSLNNTQLPPLLNSTEDRALPRFRLRLDLDAKVFDELHAVVRIASGNTVNPVSTNQTLGTSFNKTTVTFDRAYLDWKPAPTTEAWFGRMPNPWLHSELVWDEDLNFDGVAARYTRTLGELTPFVTLGAFSVENTAFDFPITQAGKVASRDKWLYALQLGTHWKFGASDVASIGAGYFYFDHLQGKRSSPCTPLLASDLCDSDDSRPAFVQKGNTMFALRDLQVNPNNPTGPQFQYFGLASAFRVLDLTGRMDVDAGDGLRAILDIDVARNLGYSAQRVRTLVPANNYNASQNYAGGQNAYYLQLRYGAPRIERGGQWNLFGGYRYIESDAVVDAFNDSDFHLGGTNAKGYWIGANYGLGKNFWLEGRWLSTTEVSGAPLAIDVLQLDINARF